MKKILVFTLILALLIPFASCKKQENTAGYCTVVIAENPDKAYVVSLDGLDLSDGLMSVLESLKRDGKITFTSVDAGYGAYLESIQNLSNQAATGEYIYIFTSVVKDQDVSTYAVTHEYEGKTLISSGVGATQMTMEDGAVIYIGTVFFG